MKLAYTICTPDTKENYLAYRGPLGEMLSNLREIGYQGVEAFVRDPREINQVGFAQMLESNGLELAAVGTGPMVTEDKLTFTSLDERVREEAIQRTKAAIDFAAEFGAQVNIGKLRGDLHKEDVSHSKMLRNQSFKAVCEYAEVKDVAITLEPQCRFAVNNLNSTQEALAWIKKQNYSNLYLMLDIFHMNIEDKSQAASFIKARDYNIHVHFADNHRGVPGTGLINFADAVRVLKALGYNRFISMEINQVPSCYQAAQRAFDYINLLLRED